MVHFDFTAINQRVPIWKELAIRNRGIPPPDWMVVVDSSLPEAFDSSVAMRFRLVAIKYR